MIQQRQVAVNDNFKVLSKKIHKKTGAFFTPRFSVNLSLSHKRVVNRLNGLFGLFLVNQNGDSYLA